MGRSWISIPIGRTGIRIGRSISDYELRPRLPSYRRYELRQGLQKAAQARGEVMKKDEATYVVDKALATGLLDSQGNLNFVAKGFTAEEIAAEIVRVSAYWGQPVTQEAALRMAQERIAEIDFWRAFPRWLAAGAAVIVAIGLIWANIAHADQYGFTDPPYNYQDEYQGCAMPDTSKCVDQASTWAGFFESRQAKPGAYTLARCSFVALFTLS